MLTLLFSLPFCFADLHYSKDAPNPDEHGRHLAHGDGHVKATLITFEGFHDPLAPYEVASMEILFTHKTLTRACMVLGNYRGSLMAPL